MMREVAYAARLWDHPEELFLIPHFIFRDCSGDLPKSAGQKNMVGPPSISGGFQ
jgi:hypothetical protein